MMKRLCNICDGEIPQGSTYYNVFRQNANGTTELFFDLCASDTPAYLDKAVNAFIDGSTVRLEISKHTF